MRGRTALGAALLLAAGSAAAELEIFSVGAELDDASGHLLYAGLGGRFGDATTWDVAASTADAASGAAALSATGFDAGLTHDFGPLALRVGYGTWSDDEVVAADEWLASLDFRGDGFSFALESEFRTSDFEPIESSRDVTLRNGAVVTLTARADCELDDVGLGARLRFTGDAWSGSVHTMSYDYDELDCAFDLPVVDLLRRATRNEFAQFGERLARAVAFGVGTRLVTETTLLDSRFGASVGYTGSKRRYRVDYDHVEEVFFGLESDTLSGSVGFVLESGNEIEAYAGATDSDAFGSVAFAGFLWLVGL